MSVSVVELETKVKRNFAKISQSRRRPLLKCEIVSRCFQPGEGPGRSLLHDFEIFANFRIIFISSSTLQQENKTFFLFHMARKRELHCQAQRNYVRGSIVSQHLSSGAIFHKYIWTFCHSEFQISDGQKFVLLINFSVEFSADNIFYLYK